MPTCDTCFDGRHYRCENKGVCACSVCAARWSKPRKTASKEDQLKQEVERDRALKALPDRRPKTESRRHVRPPRELSTDPKVVERRAYMQAWRERKKNGEPVRAKNKYTPEILDEVLFLSREGMTVREIAAQLDLDYSATARHLRLMTGNATAADLKRLPKSVLGK